MTDTSAFKSVMGAACIGVVIGSLAWSLTVWGQGPGTVPYPQTPPTPESQLGYARSGVMTMAQGRTVRIDGTSYTLAFGAEILGADGTPVTDRDIAGKDLGYTVQYWFGLGRDSNKIIRMIVFFPR